MKPAIVYPYRKARASSSECVAQAAPPERRERRRRVWLFFAQHMARAAIEGRDPTPFGDPATSGPWPMYDVFETADPGQQS